MSLIKTTLLTLLLVSLSVTAWAQEDALIQEIIEAYADQLPEDYDLFELTERLSKFRKNPIDLNSCTPEVLRELVFLSPLQVSAFFDHIAQNGKLLDVLELQSVSGFDLQTINRILPFVKVNIPLPLATMAYRDLIHKSNNDLILRYGRTLQTQKGFGDLPGSRYLGSPDKFLLRYRYNYSNWISAALVAEKDAGEYTFRRKKGVDHISGNVALYRLGKIKKIVLGDYSMQFGQGLSLWSGFAFGKGADVTSVAAKDTGLKPYSSSNESSYFRGLATTIDITGSLEISPFISFRNLDASVKTGVDGQTTLENINISGLHRTQTELKNDGRLEQLVYGATIQYASGQLNIGLLGYSSHYGHQFTKGKLRYNQYAYEGKNLLNTGVHYTYTHHNIYLYGEVAQSVGSGLALVNSLMASLSSKFSAVLIYRDYQRNYHSFFANGIGEGSETNNEKGLYAGVNYMPNSRWLFSVYGDYFNFPWLKYRIDAPSKGYETLLQTSYTPNKSSRVLFRYKREQKAQNPDADSYSDGLQQVLKQNFRLEAKWQLNRKFSFQHRAEIVGYQKGETNELGYLICQDVDYKPLSSKLSGNVRFAYFHTASYNSRVYAYEDDVLYGAGFGVYHGKGVRSFANLRYNLVKSIDIWFKYSTSIYGDVETVGSGLDEIQGNSKSDIKIQLRYQF